MFLTLCGSAGGSAAKKIFGSAGGSVGNQKNLWLSWWLSRENLLKIGGSVGGSVGIKKLYGSAGGSVEI